MLLKSPHINYPHGFTTRKGGVSSAPFESLNLGGSEDTEENIRQNRELVCKKIGFSISNLSILKQIHSAKVIWAHEAPMEADAIISNTKNTCIAVSAADCYPVLFADEKNGIIGAAHSGWKGTLHEITLNTIQKMQNAGAEISSIKVSIGPGICVEKYKVGKELIEAFHFKGFSESCFNDDNLNLKQCILESILKSGIAPTNVWMMNRCSTEMDFFSYRRDGGLTGRMWGIIGIPA